MLSQVDPSEESPTILRVDDVTKKFVIRQDNSVKERIAGLGKGRARRENFSALDGVTFNAAAGETLGLIGHNGSGKSTLLKVIGGIIRADSGSVKRRGRLAALLELGAGFHPDLSGRENVYLNGAILGLSREEVRDRFDAIVAFSEIGEFIDTQVKYYSSGMYVRLAFAVAIHTDPDLLLVDEVLAVGDEAFQQKCLAKIQEFQREGRTIIIVTHSLEVVEDMCDRAILLDHGRVEFEGDAREAVKRFRDLLHAHESAERAKAIAMMDGRIESVNVTQAGASTSIALTVSTQSGLKNWALGLRIRAADSYPVLSIDNVQASLELGPLSSGESVTILFEVGTEAFGNGAYFVEPVLFSREGYEIDVIPRAARFEILDTQIGNGVLSVPVHVRAEQVHG